MLITLFNNSQTVINMYLILQMYVYWDLEEISISDEEHIDN